MYKKINKILILVITSLYVLSYNTFICKAEEIEQNDIQNNLTPSKNENYKDYDYVINKYDVDIIVNEDNSFDITENITAYFNKEKHGIVRTIPIRNNINRLDLTSSKNNAQITNLSVNEEYTTSNTYQQYDIKIGSPTTTITGEKTYTIKYKYNIGNDPMQKYDEFYFNIIGTEWDTSIDNITFKITMPKSFDSSKLGFSSGENGSTKNNKVKYIIDDNVIIGSYEGTLDKYNGLTVRCELPEGYFIYIEPERTIRDYIMFIVPSILLVLSIILWSIFGREKKYIETVEFYPPEGLNSLELAFLYKTKVDSKDIVSLLIYLANKGYIEIKNINDDKETLLKYDVKDFKIIKLKEYDGDNINEQLFLDGIFEEGPIVYTNYLKNRFYITLDKIKKNMDSEEEKNKIIENSKFFKKISRILMYFIFYVMWCFVNYPPFPQITLFEEERIFLIFFWIFKLFEVIIILFIIFKEEASIITKIFICIICCALLEISCVIGWWLIILPIILSNPLYMFSYIYEIICFICIIICLANFERRTPYGGEMLAKIKGFKKFLETAEKDKLEMMINDNPTYFYDILPYAYVLGISNKWIKKFETISIKPPSWCESSNTFSIKTFGKTINSNLNVARSVMISSPNSSSSDGGFSSSSGGSDGGSSSSSGGSSGGGSGGGGGHSW